MSDPSLNYYVSSGTTAERTAFVPDPATPAAGPGPGYVWWDTDTQTEWAYDFGLADWVELGGGGAGNVNAGGTLTSNAVVIGQGSTDVATLASLGTAGQILTSNGAGTPPSFQNAGGGGDWDVDISKTADEDDTTTTLQDDDELFFAVGNGDVWQIDWMGLYSGNLLTTDLVIQATFPAANGVITVTSITPGDSPQTATSYVDAGTNMGSPPNIGTLAGGLTNYMTFRVQAVLSFNGAGTFQTQFCARAAGTGRMAAGSLLRGKQLA